MDSILKVSNIKDEGMTTTDSAGSAALIPTGRELKSYGIMRSLHRRGIDTVVASPLPSIPHFASRYCTEQVHLDAAPQDVSGYRDALLELAARPDVETAYPVRECDVFVFAKFRDAFEEHLSLVTPDLPTLTRAHDRYTLAQDAAEAGVPHARTRLLSSVDNWDTRVVVKSRYNVLTGEYVAGYPDGALEEVKQVTTLEAGDEPDAESLTREMNHDPIVQDYIPQADKILYTALWADGEPLATYQHRQIRQNSWVGGGGVYRKSAFEQAVEDNAATLLSHLDWHGYACIEYVKDAATGQWKFLEINPRVWQSLPEAVRAGADFPNYYWDVALGHPERVDCRYETGTGCHIAYGEVAHLLSVLRDESPFEEPPSFLGTAFDIVLSSIREPRFDYIRLDDPMLFLAGIRETLSTGVTRSRQFDAGSHRSPIPTQADGGRQDDH